MIELRGTHDLNSSFHGLKRSKEDIYIPTLIINIRSLKQEVAFRIMHHI